MPPAKRKVSTPNQRAHASLAETRSIDRYLKAIDAEAELLSLRAQIPALEKLFVKNAKSFATRKRIERESFLDAGVKESVLRKAHL